MTLALGTWDHLLVGLCWSCFVLDGAAWSVCVLDVQQLRLLAARELLWVDSFFVVV
jgi:hypothetical protein